MPGPSRAAASSTGVPGLALLALVWAAGIVLLAAAPLEDPDLFWHIEAGRRILETGSTSFPETWSYVSRPPWTSTAWLSESAFVLVDRVGGYPAFRLLKAALAGLTLWLLWRLLATEHVAPRVVVFGVTAWQLLPFFLERPQLFSLPLLVWLAHVTTRLVVSGVEPPLPVVLPVTWLWANLHGMWVLVPVALGVAYAARASDGRLSDVPALARRAGLTVGGALAVAALTPVGPALLLTPLSVRDAAREIVEWQATQVSDPVARGLVLLLLLLVVAWARTPTKVPRSEVVWVLAWTAFAMIAERNLGPAAVLIAPLAVLRLQACLPVSWSGPPVPRLAVALVLAVAGAATAAFVTSTPALQRGVPLQLVRALDGQPGDIRLLNDYNVGGLVIAEASSRVQVAVDGRADRYGAEYIERYTDLMALRGDWQSTLAALSPTHALLDNESPLFLRLEQDPDWTVLGNQDRFALLARR